MRKKISRKTLSNKKGSAKAVLIIGILIITLVVLGFFFAPNFFTTTHIYENEAAASDAENMGTGESFDIAQDKEDKWGCYTYFNSRCCKNNLYDILCRRYSKLS